VAVPMVGAPGTVVPLQAEPLGVKVKLALPLVQVMVLVWMPAEQVWVSVTPLPLEVMAWGEVKTKLPPVDADMATTIFPALTVTESATELVATVKLTTGEVRAMVVEEVKVTGAARALCGATSNSPNTAIDPAANTNWKNLRINLFTFCQIGINLLSS